MRTYVRVTSEGHAYARFRRALDRGNVTAALSAAAELVHVGLVDALKLGLLLRDDGAPFERAIVRWQAPETAGPSPSTRPRPLALLAALRGARAPTAARSLAELLDRRGHERAGELRVRWANETDGAQ